jgi:hypothetical protein
MTLLAAPTKAELSNWCQKGWLQMEDEEDEHVYEDIDCPAPAPAPAPAAKKLHPIPTFEILRRSLPKSSSDSELFHVSCLHERHEIELSCDATVASAVAPAVPEQGFYKCHDNLVTML